MNNQGNVPHILTDLDMLKITEKWLLETVAKFEGLANDQTQQKAILNTAFQNFEISDPEQLRIVRITLLSVATQLRSTFPYKLKK